MEQGTELLWGCIANKIEQIDVEESRIKWEELTNMVATAFDHAAKEEDKTNLFFDWYQFFYRIYHRVKKMDKPEPFNIISKTTMPLPVDGKRYTTDEPCFMVSNYDYRMWKYASSKNLLGFATNNYLLIPEAVLTPGECKRFEEKI